MSTVVRVSSAPSLLDYGAELDSDLTAKVLVEL